LAALAIRYSVPTIYHYRPFAAAGGLISYGTDETEYYRLVGIDTGRILTLTATTLPGQGPETNPRVSFTGASTGWRNRLLDHYQV
jgi:putative ABC transport system substrate-binding protein